ncbi:MAG: SPOR domain-containing protein [Acidobacteria bacterium]|nr:SPOR domain-containing protein [Acidobacteriota bacterium]
MAADAARPEPAASAGSYFVQVGAFELEENARRRRAALAAEGFEAYIVPFRTASGETLIAVRFGRYDSLEDALEGAKRYVELAPGREASVGQ